MEPWTARFFIRAAVATVLSGISVAATIWVDNVYLKLAAAMGVVLGGYLGVGSLSPQMEPFVGVNKNNRVEVPKPPAAPVSS